MSTWATSRCFSSSWAASATNSVGGVEGVSESLFEESERASESLEERSDAFRLGLEMEEERRGREGTRKALTEVFSKTGRRLLREIAMTEERRLREDMIIAVAVAVTEIDVNGLDGWMDGWMIRCIR